MPWGKTWTVVFRCYDCRRKFTVRHNTFDRIEALQAVYPCPFCGARPVVQRAPQLSKVHILVELNDDLETIYRKYQDANTWHFNPSCTHWPADDYIALDVAPRSEQLCNECAVKAFGAEDH
jgi:DNA-directed RNA polymerase subunit RPC12/RpoP